MIYISLACNFVFAQRLIFEPMHSPAWSARLAVLEEELRALKESYSIHSVTATSLNVILINRGHFLRVTARAPFQAAPELRTRKYYAAQLAEARARQELDVLKEVRHTGVLKSLDCPTSLLALDAVVCVTELCFQDLGACCAMRYAQEGVPADEVLRALRELLPAIQYMHSRGVCHRRVCPSRILLDSRCKEDTREWWCHLKLSGFKDGRRFHGDDMVGVVGERRYAAPEMLSRSSYCEKVDVWSGAASVAGFLFPAPERQLPDVGFRRLLALLAKERSNQPQHEGLAVVLQEALCECPRRRRSASALCSRLQLLSGKRGRTYIPEWQEALARSLVPLKLCTAEVLAPEPLSEPRREQVSGWYARLSNACEGLGLDVTGPIAAAALAMAEFPERPERRRPLFPEHEFES